MMTFVYHKEIVKTLSLVDVTSEFVSRNERRRADFGERKFVDETE